MSSIMNIKRAVAPIYITLFQILNYILPRDFIFKRELVDKYRIVSIPNAYQVLINLFYKRLVFLHPPTEHIPVFGNKTSWVYNIFRMDHFI